jgi:hypothetical protein
MIKEELRTHEGEGNDIEENEHLNIIAHREL